VIEAGTSSAKTAALRRGVDFRVAYDSVSEETFDGDPRRLARAIASVIDNAVAFTPAEGRVTLNARRSGEQMEISVTDCGPGIHPVDHERIFAAFEHAGKGDHTGSDMGLALSRRIVQLHGGSLLLNSRPGRGSIFTFLVPAPLPSPDPGPSMQTSSSGAGAGV
jgi:signal transduction histidine kinase